VKNHLNRLHDWGLITLGSLHNLPGGGVSGGDGLATALAVQVHQLGEVELGSLHDLDLPDVDIVEGIDSLASLKDVAGDGVRDQLVDNSLEVAGGDLLGDDVLHLLTDKTHLLALGITSLLLGVVSLLGEANAESTESVAVSGPDINEGLDKGLPFLDHRSELISSQVHAVEVGQAVLALNIFADQLEFSERTLSIILGLEVSQGNLVDTTLQALAGNLGSSSSVDQGLSNLADFEHGWGLDIIPFLSGEGVNDLLLGSLFTSNFQTFIFADSHIAS